MAIFNFPAAPVLGQTYTGPNDVTYTWDGEKWTGAASSINPNDFIEKTPDSGNEQFIVPGQVTDTALTLRGLLNQAANMMEVVAADNTILSVIDEEGRIGVGTAAPMFPIDVRGHIALTGGVVANGTLGSAGDVLYSDGTKSYWGPASGGMTLDSVLQNGNVSNEDMTVGNLDVLGDLVVHGTTTTINTEVINLADNIITLNSNYSGNTPNENAGIEVNRGSLAVKRLYWDETADRWTIGTDHFAAGRFIGDLTGNVTGTVSSLANHTTDNVAEGSNNLYFTQTRARNAIAATGDLVWDQNTGVMHFEESVNSVNGQTGVVVLNSDDIAEGVTNLYVTPKNVTDILNTLSINELLDVDTTTVQPNDILYYDSFAAKWLTRPGDFQDDMINGLVWDPNTGNLVATRTDGSTFTENMDGRYLELTGGTLTGPLVGTDAIFENLNVNQNLAANNASFETLTANVVNIPLQKLDDVSPNPAANGDVLYWDATASEWQLIPGVFFDNHATAVDFSSANGDVTVTMADGTQLTTNLDDRYIEIPAAANPGDVMVWDGVGFVPAARYTSNTFDVDFSNSLLGDLFDVNATGVANGQQLAWNSTTSAWELITPVETDTTIQSVTFNAADGNVVITDSTSATFAVDLDGRYLGMADGGTVAGNTTFSGNLQTPTTPTVGDDVTNKTYVDALVANSTVEIATVALDAAGDFTITETTNAANTTHTLNLYTNLDGRYVQTVKGIGPDAAGDVDFATTETREGLLTARPAAPTDGMIYITSGETTAALNGKVSVWNATDGQWEDVADKNYVDALVANSVIDTTNFTFATANGDLTIDESNGDTHTVNLDGRYAQTVNGVVPDATGNILLNITSASTGDLASIPAPASANSGNIYIVSGDANANNNGETYVFDGAAWQRIVSFDAAESDLRYINTAGDTMTGSLTLNADPTVALEAATKQYVDGMVANSEVFTSNAVFNTTNGILTQTRNDSTTYGVDLDGRYVVEPTATANGEVLTWNNVTGAWEAQALPIDPDTTVASLAFTTADGNLVLTDSASATFAVDLDGRYVVEPTATANGEVLTWNNVTGAWEAIAPAAGVDTTVQSIAFTTADGNLVITDSAGNTIAVDLDGRYLGLTDGGTIAGNAIFNGNLQTPTVPTVGNDVTNKTYVDALVANSTVDVTGFAFTAANGDVTITESNSDTHSINLDGRYVVQPNATANGEVLTWNNVTGAWEAQALPIDPDTTVASLAFTTADGNLVLTDSASATFAVDLDGRYVVEPTATANGEVLTWNNVTGAWEAQALPSGTADTTVASLAFTTADGNLVLTDSASATFAIDLDGRYIVEPTATANGEVLTWNNVTGAWEAIAPAADVDTTVASIAFSTADGNLVLTDSASATFAVDLDGRYLGLTDGGTVAGNAVFSGALQTPTAPTVGNDVTNKTYVDALVANSTVDVTNFTFATANGDLTITESNGDTHTVDLDGRYVQTVNGTAPDAAGNVAVALTSVATGDNATRIAATPTEGDVWVISGDANTALNGKAYIYDADTTSWYEVSPPDQAANDARYVNVAGDTMTGSLTLPADPTVALEAATKQYVDALVANSEVITSTAAFDNTTGVITQTRSDATTYTVDIDGRYLGLTDGGTVSGSTVFTGGVQSSSVPTVGNDVTNKTYVDALVANSTIDVTGFAFTTANGDLTITESNGDTHAVDLDGRYIVEPTATANGEVLTWNNVTGAWEAQAPAGGGGGLTFDNFITSATVNVSATAFTVDLGYANTTVANTQMDLAHGITNHTDVDTLTTPPVNGTSVLYWDGTNWVPTTQLDAGNGFTNNF